MGNSVSKETQLTIKTQRIGDTQIKSRIDRTLTSFRKLCSRPLRRVSADDIATHRRVCDA